MAKKSDPRLAAILDRSGDAATVAWAHDGQGDAAALADPMLALVAAERLGNVAALAGVQQPKELRKAAGVALHRLRSRGVKIERVEAPSSYTLTPQELDLPSRAFLSVPDREGEVELLLTASDREGSCVLAIIVGGPDFVREARHAHVTRGGLRNLWSEITQRGLHTELPFVAGLHYAERILGPRGSHEFKHFLEHVPPATVTSARVLDPMGRLPSPVEDEPASPRWMLPASMLDLGALERASGELLEAMASPEHPDEAARSAVIDAAMRSAASAALTPAARERLERFLELVIAATAHRGWSRHVAELTTIRTLIAAGTDGAGIDSVFAATRLYVAERVVSTAQEFTQPGEQA